MSSIVKSLICIHGNDATTAPFCDCENHPSQQNGTMDASQGEASAMPDDGSKTPLAQDAAGASQGEVQLFEEQLRGLDVIAVHWLRFDFVWPTFFKLFSLLFSLNSEVALKHRLGRGHAEDHSPMVGAPFEPRLKLTQIKLSPRSSVLTLTVGITRRHACKERAFGKWAGQSMSCNKLNAKYRQQTGQKTLTVFGQFVVSYFVSYYVLLLPASWPLSRFGVVSVASKLACGQLAGRFLQSSSFWTDASVPP